MNREEVFALARTKPKGDYRIYRDLKNALDEVLDVVEYSQFAKELARILEV